MAILHTQLNPNVNRLQTVFNSTTGRPLLQTQLSIYICPSDTVSPLNTNRPPAVAAVP